MLSSVLRSERAIQMNIAIMRAFVRLRELMAAHKDIAARVEKLERGRERTVVRPDLSTRGRRRRDSVSGPRANTGLTHYPSSRRLDPAIAPEGGALVASWPLMRLLAPRSPLSFARLAGAPSMSACTSRSSSGSILPACGGHRRAARCCRCAGSSFRATQRNR
jgi:hypothetical protein